MTKLLLILLVTLGLASPLFAVSKAAEVIANGRILHETVKSNVDEKTGDIHYTFEYIIGYGSSIYDCKVFTKSKGSLCFEYNDFGVMQYAGE